MIGTTGGLGSGVWGLGFRVHLGGVSPCGGGGGGGGGGVGLGIRVGRRLRAFLGRSSVHRLGRKCGIELGVIDYSRQGRESHVGSTKILELSGDH